MNNYMFYPQSQNTEKYILSKIDEIINISFLQYFLTKMYESK